MLGRLFRPVHVVVDWIATPSLRAWQHEMYRMPFVEPVARNEAARRVPDILERGGAVLLITEHERQRGPAAEVRFLGRRLRLYPTIARLARWFDVPIVPVMCRRVGGTFRFVLEFGEAIDPSRTNMSTSVRALASATVEPGFTHVGPPSMDSRPCVIGCGVS